MSVPSPRIYDESTWYKDAIIYEVRTRSFFDSNDDGIGDFAGLTSKLGYLQDLGVTAIWLLPFYPSPGHDDGYDIADYTGVHPDVGTLADFDRFIAEAHRRGLRVITELVLNHTSDAHPWFQRARTAPKGSPERDFYVWADSAEGYREARIIFKDFEVSNWTMDRVANSYFWHRFYAHQPDLNFDNPAVHQALLDVVDFWLNKGVDGLRLDAVPYLYEEEGSNCENLPRTHAFLKKLRAHIDARFPNRLLLAEANQWPEDAAAYFGAGDECHMNFHFPLMPRMFMAIHQEDRFPIVDIFAQTPAIPPSCQWALFLRNHDELTLEMVTDEERDYMYRAYADQAAMRINLGIRRRLAPLVGNGRRKMELLNGLLCSLPGTPVLYYGDEIGMGDNVYLGDRNGVRTPMQWSTDRNAGFSRADPQRLILPVVIDAEYRFEAVNVETQQQNPTSLLWWTKRLVALRKRYKAFGRGSIEFLSPENSRILAFVRELDGETVLVVANLSRFTQYAELDLSKYKGCTPVELFGKTQFPLVRDAAYMVTLGPHGFYWFSLEQPSVEQQRISMPPPPPAVQCSSVDALLLGDERPLLGDVLPAYLETRSWYAGRHLRVRSAQIESAVRVETAGRPIYFTQVRVEYTDAPDETYLLPLAWVGGESAPRPGVLAFLQLGSETGDAARGALIDAAEEPAAAKALLGVILGQKTTMAGDSEIVASTYRGVQPAAGEIESDPWKVGRERDHTSIRYGDRFMLNLARRVEEGVSPELEIGVFLSERASEIAPPLCAALELRRPRKPPVALATLHAFIPNAETGWELATKELGRYYERVLARGPGDQTPTPAQESPLRLVGQDPPAAVSEMIGSYRDVAARLGARIADLHLVLSSSPGDPAFALEPYSALDLRSKYQSLRNLTGRVLRTLRQRLPLLPEGAQREAARILPRERDIQRSFEPLLKVKVSAPRMRVHGNLHLGHVLFTGRDFVLTDLNDFRALTLAERRRKRSPLRDLAWMVRSFEFAALKVLFDPANVRESDVEAARPWAFNWVSWTSAAFLQGYLAAAKGGPFMLVEPEASAALFDAFLLERALYQLQATLDARSTTGATIPLVEIGRMLV
jgi:maltose alpha-D-glucosyltransferase / alpha-amylase